MGVVNNKPYIRLRILWPICKIVCTQKTSTVFENEVTWTKSAKIEKKLARFFYFTHDWFFLTISHQLQNQTVAESKATSFGGIGGSMRRCPGFKSLWNQTYFANWLHIKLGSLYAALLKTFVGKICSFTLLWGSLEDTQLRERSR